MKSRISLLCFLLLFPYITDRECEASQTVRKINLMYKNWSKLHQHLQYIRFTLMTKKMYILKLQFLLSSITCLRQWSFIYRWYLELKQDSVVKKIIFSRVKLTELLYFEFYEYSAPKTCFPFLCRKTRTIYEV